jgi:kinesin family member 12
LDDGLKDFMLDGVFDPFCSQDRVFRESGVVELLEHALDGYSATIFAYGQTGSGKTFTISGDEPQFLVGDLGF